MRLVSILCLAAVATALPASAQTLRRFDLPSAAGGAGPARTLQVLKDMKIDNGLLGEPVTLSVQAPYIDSRTHLTFEGFRIVRPGQNIAESMLGPKTSDVIVAWQADPAKRYVVDCELEFAMPNPEPVVVFKDVSDGETNVDLVANRAAFVTTAGRVGRVWVAGNGAFNFKSCTITPVG